MQLCGGCSLPFGAFPIRREGDSPVTWVLSPAQEQGTLISLHLREGNRSLTGGRGCLQRGFVHYHPLWGWVPKPFMAP